MPRHYDRSRRRKSGRPRESKRVRIEVRGRVQGVGFRPAVYRSASELGLRGFVSNTPGGVVIEVQGSPARVESFLSALRERPPRGADISDIRTRRLPAGQDRSFRIRPSKSRGPVRAEISPDLPVCEDCLRELGDPTDRRFGYPFLNCVNCGPRYTLIRGLPYDRAKTSMARFKMCRKCRAEYRDPSDRRFHAQPTACPACGPKLWLAGRTGARTHGPALPVRGIIRNAARLLSEGKILAVKGVGGFHLTCDASNPAAVAALRRRKYREDKPFALMTGEPASVRAFCETSPREEGLLLSPARPIVLLRKRTGCPLPEAVAPKQSYLGFMLPYAPLHHLLFQAACPPTLVMTSANVSDEPICYENKDALKRLRGIADGFLLHDRDIHIRCDDSVARAGDGGERIIRRSRGYAPAPIRLRRPLKRPVLACGAELKSTFCLAEGRGAVLSHHIGDLKSPETLAAFESGVEHLSRALRLAPKRVACDKHPDYLSTRFAEKLAARRNLPLVRVQHHHAHIASCLADNGVSERVIGLAFDGAGHGDDGAVWGGEFLLADLESCERAAHLEYFPLPGGDRAVREVWRLAAACLYRSHGEAFRRLGIDFARTLPAKRWEPVKRMIDKGVNTPRTSSMGRLFDAASALIGVRRTVRYEGQAAIELEMAAERARGTYPAEVLRGDFPWRLDFSPLFRGMTRDLRDGLTGGAVAWKFHASVARMSAGVCQTLRERTGIGTAALSGGVFQNSLLLGMTVELLREAGFTVLTHGRVPTNDGGISLGQAMIGGR